MLFLVLYIISVIISTLIVGPAYFGENYGTKKFLFMAIAAPVIIVYLIVAAFLDFLSDMLKV